MLSVGVLGFGCPRGEPGLGVFREPSSEYWTLGVGFGSQASGTRVWFGVYGSGQSWLVDKLGLVVEGPIGSRWVKSWAGFVEGG